MARLIDADALADAIKDRIDEDKEIYPDDKSSIIFRTGMRTVIGIVKNQDTVDPVKHGHWILDENEKIPCYQIKTCSLCGCRVNGTQFNFCPRCGARMDGDQNGI